MTKTRKTLRNHQTKPEQEFWKKVKGKQFFWIKFRRQYSIWRYILDFYCKDLQLWIEIDGDSHFTEDGKMYDKERTAYIEALGIKVERFTNKEIMENVDWVLEYLKEKYL